MCVPVLISGVVCWSSTLWPRASQSKLPSEFPLSGQHVEFLTECTSFVGDLVDPRRLVDTESGVRDMARCGRAWVGCVIRPRTRAVNLFKKLFMLNRFLKRRSSDSSQASNGETSCGAAATHLREVTYLIRFSPVR